jgi:hypothetical protein
MAARQREGDQRPYGDYTMRYRTTDEGERKPRHVIETFHPDDEQAVGKLSWRGSTRQVESVDVSPIHRGKGIATAMWDWSQEMTPKAKHSTDQTDQGKAWVRSLSKPRRDPPGLEATAASGQRWYHGAADTSYRMQHQGPDDDYGAPAHDVEKMMPGFYGRPSLYSHNPEHDPESIRQIRRARGNPDADVTVYRSLPHGHQEINHGDWVTPSASYARQHGMQDEEKDDWPVIKSTVKARHLHTEGDVNEFAYHGPDIEHAELHYPGGTPHQAALPPRKARVFSPVAYAADAVEQTIGAWEPGHMVNVGELLGDLPGFFAREAVALDAMVTRLREEYPLDQGVADHYAELITGLHAIAADAREGLGMYRASHQRDIERLEDPREGEDRWDVGGI